MRADKRIPAYARARLNVRGPVFLGLVTILVLCGVGGAISVLAPIDRGASFQGAFITETKVKPVQHLRGGIVGRVAVTEGAEVKAGELLVSLDTRSIDEQITAMRAQAEAAARQLDLIRREAATMAELASKQLAARSRVSALERQVADVEKELVGLQSRIVLAEQEVARSEIRAPVAGRVLSLAVHGEGAIIQPGQTVAEIVPKEDRLVIEGRLPPMHVDAVKPGMRAKVWLASLSWRNQQPFSARLAWVSPDTVEDKRTGLFFYVARIELDETRDEIATRVTLHAGMRSEILVVTGERTLVDHLLDPIVRNLNRAFRA
ncbi:MAG: HlyD family efflux transporter periplasmic adaptor subunit [Hyphomicrobiales bacterium]|nr:HlyD family efflux transporter periplasmic adaptor subunit [Hyphomicrobiales bacterium]